MQRILLIVCSLDTNLWLIILSVIVVESGCLGSLHWMCSCYFVVVSICIVLFAGVNICLKGFLLLSMGIIQVP